MVDNNIKNLAIIVLAITVVSCTSVLVQHTFAPTNSISEASYAESKETKGLVLVAASGKRSWGCGNYENAELRSIGFDLLPGVKKDEDSAPDLVINTSDRGFMNYAYALPPGTYAISYINIKVASSMRDVGFLTIKRSNLIENGTKAKGGTFEVAAGKAVYIGHFGLDCLGPTLWRYYTEDRESFNGLVSDYRSHYPFLSLEHVEYELFKTKVFGQDFTLPQ